MQQRLAHTILVAIQLRTYTHVREYGCRHLAERRLDRRFRVTSAYILRRTSTDMMKEVKL